MVAVIGGAQSGELVGVLGPIKVAAVDDGTAQSGTVTVDVLTGGMSDDVCTPLNGTAVNGSCKGVVDDQGNTVSVCDLGELFDIQNTECGICNGLAENALGIGTEGGFQFFFCAIGIDEGAFDANCILLYFQRQVLPRGAGK